MQDFDSLKNMWQEDEPPTQSTTAPAIGRTTLNTKRKLQRQLLFAMISLLLTALAIAGMALFGDFNFQHWYSYGAMVLMCLICLAQSGVIFFTYKKISAIDETTTPGKHLQQWESYYSLRKRQNAIIGPLYFLLLNVALGIYFIEIFTGRPLTNILIILFIYCAWMLFAYFYLGKKNQRREAEKLQGIIDELKGIENQLTSNR